MVEEAEGGGSQGGLEHAFKVKHFRGQGSRIQTTKRVR